MTAVARGNLFAIDGDLINRPGPRLAKGIDALCHDLETARAKRPASGAAAGASDAH
jgi:iron complex transport system substrate-binding protein